MTYPLKVQAAIEHLEDFSADVIASLTLSREYDLQRVAHDIDLLLREIGHLPKDEN